MSGLPRESAHLVSVGGRTLVCGYTEGQVLFSKPAYGGSNYVNPECALLYESESGVRSGDGLLCLQSKAIGYRETLQLKGVRATDLAAPGKIPENVVREALDSERNKNLVDRAGGLRDGILS